MIRNHLSRIVPAFLTELQDWGLLERHAALGGLQRACTLAEGHMTQQLDKLLPVLYALCRDSERPIVESVCVQSALWCADPCWRG